MADDTVQHFQQSGKREDSNPDCKHYNNCLTIAAKQAAASVPCNGCEKYEPAPITAVSARKTIAVGLDRCGEGNRRLGKPR